MSGVSHRGVRGIVSDKSRHLRSAKKVQGMVLLECSINGLLNFLFLKFVL
jgi:hypothetical protein